VGVGGVANHAFRLLPGDAPGYFSLACAVRNTIAVTGACMMVRRDVFEELGGFDETLRVAFNDIDFCLRAREKGYRTVYTPHARLFHFESATRGAEHPPEDDLLMRRRWRKLLAAGDPYYNRNLSQADADYCLAV
jgi:GT2 family glycosyltransferase